MTRCHVCEEEKEITKDIFYWGTEVFGGAARYYIYQIHHDICDECHQLIKPHLSEIQTESDYQRTGAAFALYEVEKAGAASRSSLEEVVDECAKFFDKDIMTTIKLTCEYAKDMV